VLARNPLTPVTDYQSMLNRIFWFTSAAALAATWLLRRQMPELDRLLAEIDFTIEFGGDKIVPIPGGFLLPALAVGILTRIYRLHARISDWLGIRECFDVDVVIAELADGLDVDLAGVSREELVAQRHAIMRAAFYPYVSGREPALDPQLIQQALDAWSWFWIGIEAAAVFTLTGLALVAGGVYPVGLQTLAATLLVAAIALPSMRAQCRRYAVAQVRAILADPARNSACRAAFMQLLGAHQAPRRLAA
jgi:hypothetical protein